MKFIKADIWILDDEITYRFSNSYSHFKYSEIQDCNIEHISEQNEDFDLFSIILKSGEKFAIGLNSKIDSDQLSKFLLEKLKFGN